MVSACGSHRKAPEERESNILVIFKHPDLWIGETEPWSRPEEWNQWPQGLATRVMKLGKNLLY